MKKEEVFLSPESFVTPQLFDEMKPVGNIPDSRPSRVVGFALVLLAVAIIGSAVVGVVSIMPPASVLVQDEQDRLRVACNAGDREACKYQAFSEKRKWK